MKKIFELIKPVVTVLLLCIAGVLFSGCAPHTAMKMKYDFNPKTEEIDQTWINKFAKPNKTKDVDILHKLCKPTYIKQYSNGEKSYIYWSIKDESIVISNSVIFLFNPNQTLKKTFLKQDVDGKECGISVGIYRSDENLLALLETLPSNPTQLTLKKILGEPTRIEDYFILYLYKGVTRKEDVRYILFKIKPNGRVEYMIIPKIFYEFVKKKHARFKVKTIYVSEIEINEEEAIAIEKCEK